MGLQSFQGHLARVKQYYPKVFFLVRLSFSTPLARESRLLLSHFCFHPLTFLDGSLPFLQVWAVRFKKKIQGICHHVLPQSQDLQPICFLPSTFRVLYSFCIKCLGFLALLSRKICGKVCRFHFSGNESLL